MTQLAGRIFALMQPGQTVRFLVHNQPNIIIPNMESRPPEELIITKPHMISSGSINIRIMKQEDPDKEGGNGHSK